MRNSCTLFVTIFKFVEYFVMQEIAVASLLLIQFEPNRSLKFRYAQTRQVTR